MMQRAFASTVAPFAQPRAPQVQRKAEVGPVDDPLEREADAVAERVVAGFAAGDIGGATAARTQRKCAACAAEEEHDVQRKSDSPQTAAATGGAAAAVRAVNSGGAPLDARQRAYFEPRFGRDLGAVRLHTDSRAAAAANAINARAYTWRNDIAFATGAFSPGGRASRLLLAHELTHVVQQAPHVARQPAAPYYSRTFEDAAGGDALDYTETVQVAPAQTGAGIEGSVDRQVAAHAHGALPRQTTHTGRVNHIRFTPDCKIVVPYRIQFQAATTTTTPGICNSPAAPVATPAVPAARLAAIQTQYIDAMNRGLNNRFTLNVSGCRSAQPCANGPIPIVIEAQAVTATPDKTINVFSSGGRADAASICAGSFDPNLPIHEGGHQALGAPDEYHETDPNVIAAANAAGLHWERPERERSDLSAMDDEYNYGRYTQFHERHFYFAQAFLEAVLQGQNCTVRLESAQRTPWDFRLDVSGGYAATNRGGLLHASLFAGAGIPFTARRRLNFLFGVQGQVFSDLGIADQNALMAGLRLGLEAQTTPARFGVSANLFGSAGAFYQTASTPPTYTGLSPTAARLSPYAEIGGSLGIHTAMSGGSFWRFGAEAAAGRELSNDPNALNWWRLGLVIGYTR